MLKVWKWLSSLLALKKKSAITQFGLSFYLGILMACLFPSSGLCSVDMNDV